MAKNSDLRPTNPIWLPHKDLLRLVTLAQHKLTSQCDKIFYVDDLLAFGRSENYIHRGITNDLENRLRQHKNGQSKFTKKFSDLRLVYIENYKTNLEAAKREKEIKGWNKEKKMKLVKSFDRIMILKSREEIIKNALK